MTSRSVQTKSACESHTPNIAKIGVIWFSILM